MIDIKQIRENPQKFKDVCKAKGFAVDIDKLLETDKQLRDTKKQLQDIVTDKNRIGKSIPTLSDDEKQSALAQLSELKKREAEYDENIKNLQPEFDKLMMLVAQPTDEDVPLGKDDTENVEIRKEGKVRDFDFEPKDHVQLGLALGIIDIERGVKLAGTRNYILKGDGALLHWAVLRFAMDYMVGRGYVPFSVPVLMKDETMTGTGFFPGSEDQTYQMEKDRLNLAGTAEVPLTAYHMGEILKADQLPLKYVAMSSCFRREAGAAGKDTYGLYRIHQFDKIEQVVICENNVDESNKFHDEILANAEAVMKALELPYRVVNVCTGDLGRGQVKKFDIEAWMPSRENYCETHSASKFYEFQARRLNLRYKNPATKKNLFCHTLNNTVIASPRILIPILELYQNADGSITVPAALRPYMSGKQKISI
ncbi:MAG: serine--tRNA ligase [Phycisphaerae bacterium]|nr:serine--tRNA ligase [Phycisphaerae bacterium]NIP54777.1 serine--tRNA ligase [Phycisphaerae bacterium]NIS50489.1 serine--tRNA ligase [Phycisphaerae bacterium]NIU11094.1 serine--tRNA ligase [Phycisphaerae bacterium]NIU58980.1 serine--tRNA ligase [Phycisphaerae bacterium]